MCRTDDISLNKFDKGKIQISNKTIYLILSLWPIHRPICPLDTLKEKTNKEIEVSRRPYTNMWKKSRKKVRDEGQNKKHGEDRVQKIKGSCIGLLFDFRARFLPDIKQCKRADEGSLKISSPIGQAPIHMSTANYLKVKRV